MVTILIKTISCVRIVLFRRNKICICIDRVDIEYDEIIFMCELRLFHSLLCVMFETCFEIEFLNMNIEFTV